MGTYAFYGILVLCICFIQTFGYERCTYGMYYRYCDTGLCCKISYTWYCTGNGLNTSDCDSLSQTTTRRATTTQPTITDDVSIFATVAIIGVLAVVALMAVGAIIAKKKQTNTRPSPVDRSPLVAGVYKMQSKGKKKKKT